MKQAKRFHIERFDNVKDALHYLVDVVIPKRHGYIVNVLGAKEAEIGLATTVQVVAQGMILNDDNPGLAMNRERSNDAMQRSRPSRHYCNPSVTWAGSLGLGRYAKNK